MTVDDRYLLTLRSLLVEKIAECDRNTKDALEKNDDPKYWASQGMRVAYSHILSLVPA